MVKVRKKDDLTLYVDIEKTDETGATLGGGHYGSVTGGYDEIVDIITESLNKCGSNLTCSNPFPLREYGCLADHIESVVDDLKFVGWGPMEEEINFQINVSIKIGRR